MKYLIVIVTLVALSFPSGVSAKSSGGGVHFDENPLYDCSVTKKPATPKWIVQAKSDKTGDKQVVLTWDDASRAHDVYIKYWASGVKKKTKDTGDDSREKLKNLKNGKLYSFQIQAYSNCGKSSWTKVYKFLP